MGLFCLTTTSTHARFAPVVAVTWRLFLPYRWQCAVMALARETLVALVSVLFCCLWVVRTRQILSPCEMDADNHSAQDIELIIRPLCFQCQLCHQPHLITQTTLTNAWVPQFTSVDGEEKKKIVVSVKTEPVHHEYMQRCKCLIGNLAVLSHGL